MPDHIPLVDHPDQITPEWLSRVFEKNGIAARVKSLQASPIGTGQMADNYRLALEYDGEPENAPVSVVVKVPSTDPTSRASGANGGYSTEVFFYRDLAPDVTIRIPHCHHGDISENNEEFVLVLEDLAPAEQGDQIRGCTPEEAKLALVNLAGLHGSQWCSPKLDALRWLNRLTAEVATVFSTVMKMGAAGFIERYEGRISAEDADVIRHFAENSEAWLAGNEGEHFAPLHGDYRLDNLLFGTSAGGAPVAAVDWQTLSIAPPGRDVAYFLGNSLLPELRRQHERELVGAYHEALLGHGVTDYSLETCFDDYRRGHFQGPLITVLGAMAVIQTDRGDEMFMAMSSRSCQAIRDLDSSSLL
jgi:hypothetical protein